MDEVIQRRSGGRWVFLAVLAGVLLFPLASMDRPLHIDDAGYWLLVEHILSDPLDPFSGTVQFCGREQTWISLPHPLLYSYLQSGAVGLLGGRDRSLHALALLAALIAALGILRLADRLVGSPVRVLLWCCWSPVFVVSAASCMYDIPTLAAWMVALAAFEAPGGSERRSGLLAGLLVGLASLISYYSFFLLGLVSLRALLDRRRRHRLAWTLVGAAPILAGWLGLVAWRYGVIHPLVAQATALHHRGELLERSAVVTAFLGGLLSVPLLPLIGSWGLRRALPTVILGGGAGWFVAGRLAQPLSPFQRGLFALFFAAGLLWIGLALERGCRSLLRWLRGRREDGLDLYLAVWMLLFPALLLYLQPNFAARYLLPILPAAMLLLERALQERGSRGLRRWTVACLAPTLVLSGLLWRADLLQAEAYPEILRWALHRIEPGAELRHGAEFGLRVQAERAGLAAVDLGDEFLPLGTYVLQARHTGPGVEDRLRPEVTRTLVQVGSFELEEPIPLRIYNLAGRAGFYSIMDGPLPWSLSRAPVESAYLYRCEEEIRWDGRSRSMDQGTDLERPLTVLDRRVVSEELRGESVVTVEALLQRGDGYLEAGLDLRIRGASQEQRIPLAGSGVTYRLWRDRPGALARLRYRFYPWAGSIAEPVRLLLEFPGGPDRPVELGSVALAPRAHPIPLPLPDRVLTALPGAGPILWRATLPPESRGLIRPLPEGSWRAIRLVNFLGNGVGIPDGTAVGKINLQRRSGSHREIPIRAGLETAEWAAARPGLSVGHSQPEVAWTWPVPDPNGDYPGQAYRARLPLEPPVEDLLAIELISLLPGVHWSVEALALE